MPKRELRDGLFTSEAWLSLKNNDDRVCYLALFERADNLGNQPAGEQFLLRLWRPYGIDNSAKIAKVITELFEADLVHPYQVGDKPYVHIMRFGQLWTRYKGTLNPIHPNMTVEEKQWLERFTTVVVQSNYGSNTEVLPSVVVVDVAVAVVEDENLKPKETYKEIPATRTRRKRGTALLDSFSISERVCEWAEKNGYDKLDERFEHFTGWARAKGSKYLDWDQAFMNAIRDDWAKLNGGDDGRRTGEQSWWLSEQGTQEQARKFGLYARSGEQWREFRERIRDAMRLQRSRSSVP